LELEKRVVDAVDRDVGGPPCVGTIGGQPVEGDEGRDIAARDAAVQAIQIRTQGRAEEARRRDQIIDVAEARHGQLSQARLDRRADDQRAGEHRHRDRDAGDHRQVGTPVVAQRAQRQRGRGHDRILRRTFTTPASRRPAGTICRTAPPAPDCG
jgi:hypothetical protein